MLHLEIVCQQYKSRSHCSLYKGLCYLQVRYTELHTHRWDRIYAGYLHSRQTLLRSNQGYDGDIILKPREDNKERKVKICEWKENEL